MSDGPALWGHTLAGLSGLPLVLVAATAAAVLTALHLLRERRKRVVVSFVGLWGDAAETPRQRRLGRRLERILRWLAQMLILGSLLVAAADPRPTAPAHRARSWVLLVDTTVSMAARTETGTRLEDALARARAFVSQRHRNEEVLVASAAASTAVHGDFETDPERLDEALARITQTDEPGRVDDAVAFVRRRLSGRSGTGRIAVFSDRAPEAASDLEPHVVGTPADNVALIQLGVRASAGGVGTAQVEVGNFTPRHRDVAIDLRADERPPVRITVPVPSGQRIRHFASMKIAGATMLEARIVGAADALAADDVARTEIPKPARRRVVVVGRPNLYLDGVLFGLRPETSFTRAAEAPAALAPDDVVIFDGPSATPAPARGRFLFLGPRGDGLPFAGRGHMTAPVPVDWKRGHPLLADVSLADLNIKDALRLSVEDGDEIVVAAFGGPLLMTRERPGWKAVVLAFDVRRSDLPLRPAFPLLMANALEWLAPLPSTAATGEATGEVVRVALPPEATHAEVTSPHGRRSVLPAAAVEIATTHRGVYRIAARDMPWTRMVAVNVASPDESNTRATGTSDRKKPSVVRARETAPSLTTMCLVLALLIALAEWCVYARRWMF